jgi:poly-gamma-glutamate capsule biosynthesis protein CapA/YwtB (metallophosphatase superfamily)
MQKSGICVRVSRLAGAFALSLLSAVLAAAAWASAFDDPPAARGTVRPVRPPAGRHHPRAHARVRHGPVVLAFGGDVHFEGSLGVRLATDPETALAPIAPLFAGADVVMVNLETAVGESGVPAKKQFVFRAPPSAFRALRAAHVDVVTMANNHGMDFGAAALEESLEAADAESVVVVGAGLDAHAAYSPWWVDRNGERIAIFGATQVLDGELERSWTATDAKSGLASAKHGALQRLLSAVRAARSHADVIVVYLHWGRELAPCPTPAQRGLTRSLVAAGADVIVGSHAHVLLGRGYLGRAFVDYGLGNFVFYARKFPATRTGVLLLTVRGREVTSSTWRPATITAGIPRALRGASRIHAVRAAEQLRACTDLAASPTNS